MMQADKSICCYCGGCVSVCPVDAITLRDTSLEITDKCTDCGLCSKFCPVAAISKK